MKAVLEGCFFKDHHYALELCPFWVRIAFFSNLLRACNLVLGICDRSVNKAPLVLDNIGYEGKLGYTDWAGM